ncbi:hypothetical protein CN514_20360 [Bacillus sp. AFS001701]|uniref:hypothetical protein n=1 Tax=Bacillus sp. AFS001701 TaxID=2033480 RepID=UPI000BF76085|nr:hypothetical protein [Bacillus sp. AFS001701]PET46847.1 hypothetical protein CN514_20360 [Bacillus sp. AFS001701]
MSIILEFILDVIGGMLTPSSSSREFNKQQNERVEQNINLLSNLPWFSTLLENDKNKKKISRNSRVQGMLKNQPFVDSLLEDDERCKELFLRKLDEASKKFFYKYF